MLKREPRVRTLFFGTSDFAVPSLRVLAQDTILAGVVTRPDRPAGRGHKLTPTPVKKAAREFGVPVYEPVSLARFTQERAGEAFDLFALASYGKILPAALLELPALGALNVHPSLLPKYRGATPVQTALLNGDLQTGVTIMLMDAGMDTGPVVLQERVAIAPDDDYGSLHDRLAERGADLLRAAIRAAKSKTLTAVAQQGEASITTPLRREHLEIQWSWPVARILNAVRAFSPQPAARAELHGVPVKLLHAQAVPSKDGAAVQCGDGTLYVTRLIAPNRGAVSGAAFERDVRADAR